MSRISCLRCSWVGEECDLKLSWPITMSEPDEPFGICPGCTGTEFEDVPDEEEEDEE